MQRKRRRTGKRRWKEGEEEEEEEGRCGVHKKIHLLHTIIMPRESMQPR